MRIIDGSFIRSLTEISQRKDLTVPEICFMGRSNVGKSSLLNALALRKIARTGSTPGATRLINLYNIRYEWAGARKSAVFSDFPGFGFSRAGRGVHENWEGMVEDYIVRNEWIRRVVWVFDMRRDFDDLDRMFLEWLSEKRLGFSLVLTKADKESRGTILQKRQAFQRMLGMDDVFSFSSRDGEGRKEITAHILSFVSDTTS